MDYVELRITASDPAALELLYVDLEAMPVEAVEQDGNDLLAYLPADQWDGQADFPMAQTRAQISWTERRIAHQNWNEVWESSFDPLSIGNELLIYAPFHTDAKPEAYRYAVQMVPKMAFGTGHHPTTYLMLERVLGASLDGARVLDMGCGTAVLGIVALMHGASQGVGIEIEAYAADNARELVEGHGLKDRFEVRTGDANQLGADERFDVIYANIHRNVLLADMGRYAQALNPGGTLHLSGFYRADASAIQTAAEQAGLRFVAQFERDAWVALTVEKTVE
jgi:ribosomal protein L11 methyltransferase